MQDLLKKVGLNKAMVNVIWEEGRPVETLNRVCKRENVDLLVLGANRNEAALKYYIGSVARKISRNPNCSLLLITAPSKKETDIRKVVVNGINHYKTAHTLSLTFEFAKKFNAKIITIVEEVSSSKIKTRIEDDQSLLTANLEKKQLEKQENDRIREIILPLKENLKSRIKLICIFGKIGYSIAHYSEIKKASLLIMNSPDNKLGFFDRFFPHDLEYVLSDMPCDLMIVHPKNK